MKVSTQSLFPFLKWLPLLKDKKTVQNDFWAGLTGAIIVLPQGVAFALIAGMPPVYGLYTAMLPAVVAALFGSSYHLVSGPTTTASIMMFAFLTKYASAGSPEFIQLALTLTFLVGITKLIFGLARLGTLVDFVSNSVIVGYTAGAALLIAFKQLENFTGVAIPPGLGFYEILFQFTTHLQQVNPHVLAVSVSTLLSGALVRRFFPRAPFMIVAMLVGSVVGYLLQISFALPPEVIKTVGALPAHFPPLTAPDLTYDTFIKLLPAVMAATILTLTEAVSIARSVAIKSGQILDINQEFIGQGLSNIAGTFTSGYLSTGSFNRTGANYEAHARTPLAAILAGLLLMFILALVAPLAAYLPNAAMAGILFLVAYGITDIKSIKTTIKTSKGDTVAMAITFLGTLFLDLEFAILTGVIASLIYYLSKTSRPAIHTRIPNPSDSRRKFISDPNLPECPQLKFIRIDGSIYFGAVTSVRDAIWKTVDESPDLRHLTIVAQGINFIDTAGADLLNQIKMDLQSRGIQLYFYSVKPCVLETLKKCGFLENNEPPIIYDSKGEIISHVISKMNADVCRSCKARIFNECAGLPGATSSR